MEELKVGDIYLTRPRSWLGKVICFWTRSKFSHSGILIDPEAGIGIEATFHGIKNVHLYQEYKNKHIVFLRAVPNLSKANRDLLTKFVIAKKNTPYDFSAILGFLFYKKWQRGTWKKLNRKWSNSRQLKIQRN